MPAASHGQHQEAVCCHPGHTGQGNHGEALYKKLLAYHSGSSQSSMLFAPQSAGAAAASVSIVELGIMMSCGQL
jgi:hypothetical protein